ncbi:hypothetical protein THAOC_14860, partial [Thalassiosira oceanica]
MMDDATAGGRSARTAATPHTLATAGTARSDELGLNAPSGLPQKHPPSELRSVVTSDDRSVGASSFGGSTFASSRMSVRELAREERRRAKRARKELEEALAGLPAPQFEYKTLIGLSPSRRSELARRRRSVSLLKKASPRPSLPTPVYHPPGVGAATKRHLRCPPSLPRSKFQGKRPRRARDRGMHLVQSSPRNKETDQLMSCTSSPSPEDVTMEEADEDERGNAGRAVDQADADAEDLAEMRRRADKLYEEQSSVLKRADLPRPRGGRDLL